jgi:outer membrane lipoprotein SlyB
MRTIRLASIACGGGLVALLSACTAPAPTASVAPARTASIHPDLEYGRITNIQPLSGGTTAGGVNVPGAIIGAVAGGVLGNQIGSGRGQGAAAVLGAAGGAAVGSQVGRNTTMPQPTFRVTVQTQGGAVRYYDVPSTGDLRVGDLVRVQYGVISRT